MSAVTSALNAVLGDPRRRRLALALSIYLLTTVVFMAFAATKTLTAHTRYNHFALLAQSWLEGRLDLSGPPPSYTGYNDFARVGDRWFVVFPPFPALLILPVVWLAGGQAADVADGQFFLWFAGIAPAVLFLLLEKLERLGFAALGERKRVLLSLTFAFGTVYFFSAEQGTVWYAAHVVGCGLFAIYLLASLDAERPALAGFVLGLAFLTRAPMAFGCIFLLMEAWRTSTRDGSGPSWRRVDRQRLLSSAVRFSIPFVALVLLAGWHNQLRFGEFWEFGYRYLDVRWKYRMAEWGLFHYHYLGKNLGVVLTSLPWVTPSGTLQVNGHGLALWITSPFYLWLLWPRRRAAVQRSFALTALAVAVPTLFYQNTGWVQFGYRFSNDYALCLIALLALGGYRFRRSLLFAIAGAVVVNAWGALTFSRRAYKQHYYIEPTQKVLYQTDR